MKTTSADLKRLIATIRGAQEELEGIALTATEANAAPFADSYDHLNDGLSNLEVALDDLEHAAETMEDLEVVNSQ